MTTFITTQNIIDEIHDELLAVGITRPDSAIESALERAAENWAAQMDGPTPPLAELRARDDRWHEARHMRGGVFDLLGVDSEDALYDRMEGEAW